MTSAKRSHTARNGRKDNDVYVTGWDLRLEGEVCVGSRDEVVKRGRADVTLYKRERT